MNITYIGRQVTVYDDMKQMVEKKLAKLAEQYKMEEKQIRDIIPMDALKRDLRLRKASELVVAAAKVGEPEKKDEEPKAE